MTNTSNATCVGAAIFNVVNDARSNIDNVNVQTKLFSAALLSFGLVMLTLGHQILEPALGTLGAVGGVVLVYGFIGETYEHEIDLCDHALIFAGVSAFCGALLMISMARCAVWMITFFVMSAIGHQFSTSLLGRQSDESSFLELSIYPDWLLILSTSVFMSLLLRKHKKYTDIVITSMAGGMCFSVALRSLFNTVEDRVSYITSCVLAICGIPIQLRVSKLFAKKKDRDKSGP